MAGIEFVIHQIQPDDIIETVPEPIPYVDIPEGWEDIWDDPEFEFAKRAQLGLNIIDEVADGIDEAIIIPIDEVVIAEESIVNQAITWLQSWDLDLANLDLGNLLEKITLTLDSRLSAFEDKTGLEIRKALDDLGIPLDSLTDAYEAIENKLDVTIPTLIDNVDANLDTIIDQIKTNIDAYSQTVEDFAQPAISFIQESLPQQLTELKDSLASGLSAIPDIPDAIGNALTSGLDTVFKGFGLDDLLGLFQMFGKIIGTVSDRVGGFDDFELSEGSWDLPKQQPDERNIQLAQIPIIGSAAQQIQPAEFRKAGYRSSAWTRPDPLDIASTLEYIRRFPEDKEQLLVNLHMLGLSDERIDQLLKIIHTPLPAYENIEGYRRGFITEEVLTSKLQANGLSNDDIELIRSIALRLPPIQDLILFSVRGVFDVEESRRFGEFEGLPADYEEAFIEQFGQGGGDFSTQVGEFGKVAQQLGLSKEWVSAYWASHWRLPSLGTAFQMFHRLNPEIVEAEASELRADGFEPDEITFDRESLDRLVRSSDYSGYWRPKLSAIAYRPLTRVDVRRMHKLGVLDDSAVRRSYLKLGYSPTDADRMTQFTLAYNAEPETTQVEEVRNLTKSQILDFLENGIFDEEESQNALGQIGYESETARAFVEITLADRDRKLQKTAINLVEERVSAGLIDLNAATLELDDLGIPATNKALIIRELEIKLAKRTKQPTRPELDKFLKNTIISEQQYSVGMESLGYPDEWITRFLELNRMGMLE